MSDDLRQLDEACARMMDDVSSGGWFWHPDEETHMQTPVPYSSDAIAARRLEDEIERWGLVDPYIGALLTVLGLPHEYNPREMELTIKWALMRASPEQRARAFLLAVPRPLRRLDK